MTVFQFCSIASALLVCTLPVASAQGSPRQNVQAAGERTEAFTPMVRVTFANGVQAELADFEVFELNRRSIGNHSGWIEREAPPSPRFISLPGSYEESMQCFERFSCLLLKQEGVWSVVDLFEVREIALTRAGPDTYAIQATLKNGSQVRGVVSHQDIGVRISGNQRVLGYEEPVTIFLSDVHYLACLGRTCSVDYTPGHEQRRKVQLARVQMSGCCDTIERPRAYIVQAGWVQILNGARVNVSNSEVQRIDFDLQGQRRNVARLTMKSGESALVVSSPNWILRGWTKNGKLVKTYLVHNPVPLIPAGDRNWGAQIVKSITYLELRRN